MASQRASIGSGFRRFLSASAWWATRGRPAVRGMAAYLRRPISPASMSMMPSPVGRLFGVSEVRGSDPVLSLQGHPALVTIIKEEAEEEGRLPTVRR